ncbi:alpha-mannosidase 2-like [Artemia franciscana]|uniref:Alpha-mannosidase n=1 Tax=Artemia franciscana TaxID=6661 RepID=A0AA88LHK8_ARTSF|nr:hypothetical protein QYM36_007946 [Artemia franciscana]KAK2727273.1 hypothetical protein QYM36_007946 [Artemia franciscana]KAK2727274.1 hypothetical protein QYM36_007946 [Artemia franciscana]
MKLFLCCKVNMILRPSGKRSFVRYLWFLLTISCLLFILVIYKTERSGQFSFTRSKYMDLKINWQKRVPAAMEAVTKELLWREPPSNLSQCPTAKKASTNITTWEQFPKFNLHPAWIKSREFWDSTFEERYKKRRDNWKNLPLKVILMPHSHVDPGWLKTFDRYYEDSVKHILNNMIDKLDAYKDLTFIWTEISFFSKWWKDLHPRKRKLVKKFVREARLEFTSGSWVMTDEATTHFYSMLDQIIEGHQWLKSNIGVTPKSSWSIDTFGHGPVAPYLMRSSGLNNTVTQRMHYTWKQWLAAKQADDFIWRQTWDSHGDSDILCHNFPFDIYSIKHSCGPHPNICVNYDFRKIRGEFTEYGMKAEPVDKMNIKEKAEILLEEYGRSASLFQHNVVLVPIGDDFRYDKAEEWDQQYINYKQLADYINKNRDVYNTDISFGTLSDYFSSVRSRQKSFTTIQGDFFVYSDIFTDGIPAYWSGYFTTRPYWKAMTREVEANLRAVEILYSFASQRARQTGSHFWSRILDKEYTSLSSARQNLGLFQHHDAITGTSKENVMLDYGQKLLTSLKITDNVLNIAASSLLSREGQFIDLTSDIERQSFGDSPVRIRVNEQGRKARVLLYNSDPHFREEVIKVKTSSPYVLVKDPTGTVITHQINPVWTLVNDNAHSEHGELFYSKNNFEVVFIANLDPLSLALYEVIGQAESSNTAIATVYKNGKLDNRNVPFDQQKVKEGDIQLENNKMKVRFDGRSGLMRSITLKSTGRTTECQLVFGAYQSTQFRSGSYLFKPDVSTDKPYIDILNDQKKEIIIVTGPVQSEVTVLYGSLLIISFVVYHKPGSILESGVHIEHFLDISGKYRETEVFMRFLTDIQNYKQKSDNPVFFADINGFQIIERKKHAQAGIEGNYYPITSAAYIEDSSRRFTVLVSRAHGSTGFYKGGVEVMLDRRMMYDDGRGMGEGVVDNKNTLSKFWIVLEDKVQTKDEIPKLSLLSHRLSNALLYPTKLFLVEDGEVAHKRLNLITKPLPCDVNMVNLKTLADEYEVPSQEALLVLHKIGYSCNIESVIDKCAVNNNETFYSSTEFNGIYVSEILKTSLSGLHDNELIKSFDKVQVPPMELRAYKLRY